MGLIRRISDIQLGSIGTTKALSITSVETYYQISSGNRAFEIGNFSNVNIIYGQSSVLANSGLIISSGNGAKFWDSVVDNFCLYLAVNSAGYSASVVVHEYRGN